MIFKKNQRSKEESNPRSWVSIIHTALNFALPIALLLLVRADLIELSIILALFSKWRVFAVRPRHILTNLKSNSTDIIVKLSTLYFIIDASSTMQQLVWTLWYIVWLIAIKPKSNTQWVGAQALIGQILGLSAVLQAGDQSSMLLILFAVWVIALSTVRHFLSSYEEPFTLVITHLWALFVVEMAWVLYHWTLVYSFVPQIVFIVSVIGYTLASLYHAKKNDSLKSGFIRQQLAMSSLILLAVIILADWQGDI